MNTPAAEAGSQAHREFGQKYADVLRGGEALQPTGTATTIRDGVVTGETIRCAGAPGPARWGQGPPLPADAPARPRRTGRGQRCLRLPILSDPPGGAPSSTSRT